MEHATVEPDPADDDIRMGSEYTDARTYLSKTPRGMSLLVGRKKPPEKQHGSNDSDFGMADQRQD